MKVHAHRLPRQSIAFLHDVVMAGLSFVAALSLRLGEDVVNAVSPELVLALLIFMAVCAVVFSYVGLYRGIWRYASLSDLEAILRAATFAILIFLPVTFLLTRLAEVPRTALVINWFVLVFLLGAPRILYRIFKDRGFDHVLERHRDRRTPVLLVGAGDAAEVFIREMARDRQAPYAVLGIVDEKGTRVGRRIHGVEVIGHIDALPQLLEKVRSDGREPQRLIVTKRLPRDDMKLALDVAEAHGMSMARLPRMTELAASEDSRIELRPIAIEDLLGRTQARLDRGAMARLIEGRRVLITGAGGSIGAELVRQVAKFRPAHLSLLDHSEFQLYTIGIELDETHEDLSRTLILADVRDRDRLERVVKTEAPEIVFHAAALKHVPMVEANPLEGLRTNAMGARAMADICSKTGVTAMVLISTDKAIHPTSVMGATKRLAETYCQALDIAERRRGANGTRFITVRFGNVLGSTGSVVPMFQRQLAAGGPLTVTHPDMRRYFMTISEAVELVLQASVMGVAAPASEAGKIYVLDMGEPVKIMDLARHMIRLSGQRPDKDVEIKITGLRPGEKLFEELFHEGEPAVPTAHPNLHLAAPRTTNEELLRRSLDELEQLASAGREAEALALFQRLVPEYTPFELLRASDAVAGGDPA